MLVALAATAGASSNATRGLTVPQLFPRSVGDCKPIAHQYCCDAGIPCNCSATIDWPGQCDGNAFQYVRM